MALTAITGLKLDPTQKSRENYKYIINSICIRNMSSKKYCYIIEFAEMDYCDVKENVL